MDLIFANEKLEDVGVLMEYEFDLAFGKDENNFELKVDIDKHCCKAGYFVYIEGTEYGGIVDGIAIDTASEEVTYSGRTWHGILGSKIITPAQGGLNIGGSVGECLANIIARVGLSDLFAVGASVGNVNSRPLNAYTDAYTAITDILKNSGMRLHIEFNAPKATLSALPIVDYSKDEQFDSDLLAFQIKKATNTVNHLVCIGSERADGSRLEAHLYADANGTISQTQTFFGLDEYALVYETSTESTDELIESGTEFLQKELIQDAIEIDLDDESDRFGIGDIVGAFENVTETEVAAPIIKKIVTVKNGRITISYEVGEKI